MSKDRTKIDDMRRARVSKRAYKGKLTVIKERCAVCGHHKKFLSLSGGSQIARCTKCGAESE